MKLLTLILFICLSLNIFAEENKKVIILPKPTLEKNINILEVFNNRKSLRAFKNMDLSLQDLSNILYAGYGINRKDLSKRTAPSAYNLQYVDIYAALKDGFYLYDAKENKLVSILDEDIREMTGMQDFVKNAPLNLVFVSNDKNFNEKIDVKDYDFYSAILAGAISQNIYLYCSAENISTVARGSVPREELSSKLNFLKHQKIIFAQSVGYAAE